MDYLGGEVIVRVYSRARRRGGLVGTSAKKARGFSGRADLTRLFFLFSEEAAKIAKNPIFFIPKESCESLYE
jgi:hypothetical protein